MLEAQHTGNLFQQIPGELPEELFTTLVEKDGLKIERIVSKGHTSPDTGWYDQAWDEWVVVLQGAAKIEFEGGFTETLQPGDYVNIPAHARHKVSWTDPAVSTVWLAVHG